MKARPSQRLVARLLILVALLALSASSSTAHAADGAVFPVKLSADKNYLVGADGRPFLVKGDSAWSAIAQLSRADATTYLDSRAALGFNAILVNLIEPAFSSHTPKWRNAEGQVPFATPDDFSALNDAYFTYVDWFLSEAERRGILVLLVPAYLGFQCGAEGWCKAMQKNGVAKLSLYGQYVGARYKSVKNIVWIEGGDDTPSTLGSPSILDLVNAVASGIKQADGSAHLHAAHWGGEVSGFDGPSVPWLDIDTTYSHTSPHLYQKTLSDHARDVGKRPLFLIESLYEDEHSSSNLQLRAQMYQPVLSGGTGFLFGNFPIWEMWNPGDSPGPFNDGKYPGGWKTALQGSGSLLASVAFKFFDSIPWQTLAPDTAHQVLVAGYGAGDAFALCAVDAQRSTAVTYLTSNLTLQFDLSRFSGPLTARWFDPSTGFLSSAAPGPLPNAGSKSFTPPVSNGDGSADWVLLLQLNPSSPTNPVPAGGAWALAVLACALLGIGLRRASAH